MNLPKYRPEIEAEARAWLEIYLRWSSGDFDDGGMIFGQKLESILAAFYESMTNQKVQ